MRKKPWLKRVASAAILGGLLLGSVGIVYAADSDTVTNATDKMKARFHSMMPGECGHGSGMMGKEVDLGMSLDLDALVQDGIITSEESAAIQVKIDALKAQRQAEMDKFKDMTAEERQAYIAAPKKQNNDEKNPVKTDFLTILVNENIISNDKAEAIRTIWQTQREAGRQSKLNESMTALVDNGTINSSQSDAILAAIQTQQQKRQTEMEKFKVMTKEERESYFKENKPVCNDCLTDLITAGTITQAQADAVSNLIGGVHGKNPGDASGADWGNCPNRSGDKSTAAPGLSGCGESQRFGSKGHGGQGHGGMGNTKGYGLDIK